jgi:hypothetical protein
LVRDLPGSDALYWVDGTIMVNAKKFVLMAWFRLALIIGCISCQNLLMLSRLEN